MTKLLVVDDEQGIVDEIMDFFLEEGFDVKTADTGEEGMRLLIEFKPDILILDIKLPDMSGLDVLRQCKQIAPATKVIVNTGYVDQNIIDEAAKLGRDVFLQKPFDLELLSDEVTKLSGGAAG